MADETTTTDEAALPDHDKRSPRKAERKETGRKARRPLGTPSLRLEANVPAGYVGRWINDDGARIQNAQEAGYEFCEDGNIVGARNKGRKVAVGKHDNGQPKFAYLMAIRKEFYDEDQRAKMEPLDEMERQMKGGVPSGADEGDADRESFYVPAEGITIERV